MAHYRKRPIIIEATQLEEDTVVKTKKGDLLGREGNMLITGVEGEQYPCDIDIFKQTYEPVDGPDADTVFVDLCIDFDGVLHDSRSKWIDATTIPDPPVQGAIPQLHDYLRAKLTIAILSARSHQPGGIPAMQDWLDKHDREFMGDEQRKFHERLCLVDVIEFPMHKPAATMYIDDRGWHYNGPGTMPDLHEINTFTPWNRHDYCRIEGKVVTFNEGYGLIPTCLECGRRFIYEEAENPKRYKGKLGRWRHPDSLEGLNKDVKSRDAISFQTPI